MKAVLRRRRSSTRPTGRNISATSLLTDRATSISISIRCGHAVIDAIGIDVYWPLADWREGATHLDCVAGARSIYDAGLSDRNLAAAKASTGITPAPIATRRCARPSPMARGKPWVFRYKDITSWWLNPHYDRPGGVEAGTPTDWVPQSKPFWLMESAVRRSTRAPTNLTCSSIPKSSETALPVLLARHAAMTSMQRRYLRALIEAFDPDDPTTISPGANPVSEVYGGRMVDLDARLCLCLGRATLSGIPERYRRLGRRRQLAPRSLAHGSLCQCIAGRHRGACSTTTGSATTRRRSTAWSQATRSIASWRRAKPAAARIRVFFDPLESGAAIAFRHRGDEKPSTPVRKDDIVESRVGRAQLTLARGQETELPSSPRCASSPPVGDYRQSVAEARRSAAGTGRVAKADLPLVLDPKSPNRRQRHGCSRPGPRGSGRRLRCRRAGWPSSLVMCIARRSAHERLFRVTSDERARRAGYRGAGS